MTKEESEFVALYESQANVLRMLNLLEEALTKKGKETKRKVEKFLAKNLDKYLTITGV